VQGNTASALRLYLVRSSQPSGQAAPVWVTCAPAAGGRSKPACIRWARQWWRQSSSPGSCHSWWARCGFSTLPDWLEPDQRWCVIFLARQGRALLLLVWEGGAVGCRRPCGHG